MSWAIPNLAVPARWRSPPRTTIAMVVPNLAEAVFEMFAGLQQILQPAGYQIMLAERSIA